MGAQLILYCTFVFFRGETGGRGGVFGDSPVGSGAGCWLASCGLEVISPPLLVGYLFIS